MRDALGLSMGDLEQKIADAGYFEVSLRAQTNLAAAVLVKEAARADVPVAELIELLLYYPAGEVKEFGPAMILHAFRSDLEGCLAELEAIANWPSKHVWEQAHCAVHNLVRDEGYSTVAKFAENWIHDDRKVVRSLWVEALRPRGVMLPHIMEFRSDPSPLRPVLEAVLDDENTDVRKAAANLLGDIAKDHPDIAVDWARAWLKAPPSAGRRWIVHRGLRASVKKAHGPTLKLLGYANPNLLHLSDDFILSEVVSEDEPLEVSVRLGTRESDTRKIWIQAKLTGPTDNDRPRTRSFSLGERTLSASKGVDVRKNLNLAQRQTTRLDDGEYAFAVFANGRKLASATFEYRG